MPDAIQELILFLFFGVEDKIIVAAHSPKLIPVLFLSKGLHISPLKAWKDLKPDKMNFEITSAPATTIFSYSPERIKRMPVKMLNTPEMQALEDVICLVFLENYFSDFAREKDEAKLINILRRTWAKMSEQGRAMAMTLTLSDDDKRLIAKALDESGR